MNLKKITDYLKLPYYLIPKRVKVNYLLLLPSKLTVGSVVTNDDNTASYYSSNNSKDGKSHDVNDMFINTCILISQDNNLSDDVKNHLIGFVRSNIHGGKALTNGCTFKPTTFKSNNLNINTFAGLLLMFIKKSTFNSIDYQLEIMWDTLKENGYKFNYVTDPENKKSDKFKKALEVARYENLKVVCPIDELYLGEGCSPEALLCKMAFLAGMSKRLQHSEYSNELSTLENTLLTKIKIKSAPSSFATIVSLDILSRFSTNSIYSEELSRRFSCDNDINVIRSNVSNYLFSFLNFRR